MSLRAKFLILVIGAIFAPPIVFLISYQVETGPGSLGEARTRLVLYRTMRSQLHESPLDLESEGGLLNTMPDTVEVRILDSDGNLLFSRMPDELLNGEGHFRFTEIIPVKFVSGENGTAIITRHPGPLNSKEDRWFVPLTVLIFVSVMIVTIVQSVNRSISNLEKATRRIVGGDLDFKLPMKGHDKLASLTRSFESMRAHLKEEYARRSRFIMGISHDLKTPLASVRGYTEAIGEGYADTPEKLSKYLGIIGDKTQLLESRINMLIDYVRRETNEWKLSLQPVRLAPLLRELSNVIESEITISGREIVSRIDVSEETEVQLDEGMFTRALENLVQNAIRYSPEESTIRFSGVQTANTVFIAISNEGEGIEPDDLPHIFNPFVRGGKDRKGPGLGLGLSTVEAVISSHGWEITANSKSGETTFTIAIPMDDVSV